MSHGAAPPSVPSIGFARACDCLSSALGGDVRHAIVASAYQERDLRAALARLRTAMRTHVFRHGAGALDLSALVGAMDSATRREGFHVFLEWHEVAYRFIEEDIPVVLLDYFASLGHNARKDEGALAILLDYYFLYVLALVATRAWEEGDPAANLDRVTALVADLQGPAGSGRRFVDDAESLLWIAISTYEPDDLAYHRLLQRVRSLAPPSRRRVGAVGAPLLGCHLRWGFPHLYESDLGRMRADNFIDYPWLLFALAELTAEYDALRSTPAFGDRSRRLAGALLSGLSPDPEAFLGEAPPSLAAYPQEHALVRARLERHRLALLRDFERHAPVGGGYSPLGLHFNFPHNATFAMAVLALVDEATPNLSLNTLLDGGETAGPASGVLGLAGRLTAFAAANPEPRGSRSVLGLYYDPDAALAAYQATRRALGSSA